MKNLFLVLEIIEKLEEVIADSSIEINLGDCAILICIYQQ